MTNKGEEQENTGIKTEGEERLRLVGEDAKILWTEENQDFPRRHSKKKRARRGSKKTGRS